MSTSRLLQLFSSGKVSWTRLPIAGIASLAAPYNSAYRLVSELLFRRNADDTKIESPIFVIGHWRSGTTLLHELMALDDRYSYPTTYDCVAPDHFLFTQSWLKPCLGWMTPKVRAMDQMKLGLDLPQEDELALLVLGAPSPYKCLAFPQQSQNYLENLDLANLEPTRQQEWRSKLLWFYRRLTYRDSRPLILKSPTHTARIRVLVDLFPDAKFIHIVRNPVHVYLSTLRLWHELMSFHGLQSPIPDITEFVLSAYEKMYECFERDRSDLSSSQICEIKFEDMTSEPVATLRKVYEALQLEGFERQIPLIEKRMSFDSGSQRKYSMDDETRLTLQQRWGATAAKLGYEI